MWIFDALVRMAHYDPLNLLFVPRAGILDGSFVIMALLAAPSTEPPPPPTCGPSGHRE